MAHARIDPALQARCRASADTRYEQPTRHRWARTQVEFTSATSRQIPGVLRWMHPDDQVRPIDPGTHVAIEQERQPPEHALLSDAARAFQQSADAVGERLVERRGAESSPGGPSDRGSRHGVLTSSVASNNQKNAAAVADSEPGE